MAFKTINQPTEKTIVQFSCKFATQSRAPSAISPATLVQFRSANLLLPLFKGWKFMARRKNAKKPAPKKRMPKLDKKFTCPFCHHPESVECTIDRKLKIGKASCFVCSESYCMKINFLTEAIDIYSEWLDACEAANSNSSPIREKVHQPVSPRYIDLFDD